MTKPTPEAAEIVAGCIGPDWSGEYVLSSNDRPALAFAQYVTNEYEVTDAMAEAGAEAWNAAADHIDIFHAMIAVKHKALRPVPVDPLVEALVETFPRANGAVLMAQDLREALAKRGLEIREKAGD